MATEHHSANDLTVNDTLPADALAELATLCERDEAGRHFTEVADWLDELESAGMIEIDRPIHEATGIPYSQEYWHLSITDAGIAAVEAADALAWEASA